MRTATVIGAGVFGAWTAWALKERGWRVSLIEQHGPGHARSSSGGETRIIRCGYGAERLYARWARESLSEWLGLELRTGETLFVRTGALFVGANRQWLADTHASLCAEQIPSETIPASELRLRFGLHFDDTASAVLEKNAGVLFARRAVQTLVRSLVRDGVSYVHRGVDPDSELRESTADAIVLACGAWLPSLFPSVLRDVIVPTRQEVFFFGPPRGDPTFAPGRLPAWIAFDEGIYGVPDLEHRGVKIAVDAHGEEVDPEHMDRTVDAASVERIREALRRHLPALAAAPLVESRVCQYENTAHGHFLLDRLPGHDRAWIAGGGSGHGFKHGPAVGRYMADLIEERRTPDRTFALDGRPPRARAVY